MHPLFIKWCLYLHYQSGKAYDMLQQSGCIYHQNLPCKTTPTALEHAGANRNTLAYTQFSSMIMLGPGFSAEEDGQLHQVTNMTSCKEWQKFVCLLLDKMHIRQDLVKIQASLMYSAILVKWQTYYCHSKIPGSWDWQHKQPTTYTDLYGQRAIHSIEVYVAMYLQFN